MIFCSWSVNSEFVHNGRIRTSPAPWRIYRAGASVHIQHIEVLAYPGKQEDLRTRLQDLPRVQAHLFPGTMQRYISIDQSDPALHPEFTGCSAY